MSSGLVGLGDGLGDGIVGCPAQFPVDSIFTPLAREDPVPSFPENITTFTS